MHSADDQLSNGRNLARMPSLNDSSQMPGPSFTALLEWSCWLVGLQVEVFGNEIPIPASLPPAIWNLALQRPTFVVGTAISTLAPELAVDGVKESGYLGSTTSIYCAQVTGVWCIEASNLLDV